jgi:hypothetical protein
MKTATGCFLLMLFLAAMSIVIKEMDIKEPSLLPTVIALFIMGSLTLVCSAIEDNKEDKK